MGKPRPKKKVTVVFSSDEDEDVKLSTSKATAAAKPKHTTSTAKKGRQSRNGTPQSSTSRKGVIASPASQKSQPSPSPSKPNRTLYSFFNAQTQRQQIPPSTNGQRKKEEAEAEAIEEEIDGIEDDDSLDEALVNLDETKFGSKYPMPVRRKRKINYVEDSSSLPKGSQMFKRAATESIQLTRPTIVDQRPWTERFGPISLEELAVHKKKVQDVKSWLHRVASGQERKRLLVLKGAAGSGKTVTVNLISQDLGLHVHEWRTNGNTSSEEGFVSMSAQFQDFVARTGTFGMLDFALGDTSMKPTQLPQHDDDKRQLVLIEEFPNTFSRSSSGLQSFRTAVLQYLEASTPAATSFFASQNSTSKPVVPIVMIISESLLSTSTAASDSFTAYRLLGPDILGHQGTTVIEFNAIAPTFMTKALDAILQKESKRSGRRRAPGPSVLKHLAEIGDIRSAISSLEFLCLRGDDGVDWSGRVTFTKQKKGTDAPMSIMETESLQLVTQRESTLGIFHAVGKVVYNKRETPAATDTPPPQPPNHLPQHARPKVSGVNTETLLNELGTDISTFIAALHENYILSCQGLDSEETLDHINGCIDALSDADILSPDRFSSNQFRQTYAGTGTDSLRQDEISFQVSVRGLLFSLPHPVKRISPAQSNTQGKTGSFGGKNAAYQMFYPASQRIWRRQEETKEALTTVVSKLRDRLLPKGNKDLSKPSAVEAWRLNRFSGQNAPTQVLAKGNNDDSEAAVASSSFAGSMAKGEMLLERLPYISLMRRHNKLRDLQDLGKEFDKITRISGAVTLDGDEEDEGEGAAEGVEQWSTDRPVEDVCATKRKSFAVRKSSSKSDSTVKDKMESLVLEDDDIEDD
jgi:cell cycle checkpoint protein